MFKVVTLLKRRPGTSLDEFQAYYEQHHAKIGEAALPGRAKKYIRRYFQPIQSPAGGGEVAAEPEFDAQMEMWFDDEASFGDAMSIFSGTALGDFVVADEAKLFDRSKIRMFIVDERETDLVNLPTRSVEEIHSTLGID